MNLEGVKKTCRTVGTHVCPHKLDTEGCIIFVQCHAYARRKIACNLKSVLCACCRRLLQEQFGLESNRSIPEWGRDIFSDMCVIVRPEDPDELSRFIQYCIALHQTHLILSQHARPVTEYKCAPPFLA